jgi:hypothetical protein
MATNILTVNIITGKTYPFTLGNTPRVILSNPDGSDFIYKINSIYVCNNSEVVNIRSTTDFFRNDVGVKLASNVRIPKDSTIIVMAKETSIYLEPGDMIRSWIDVDSAQDIASGVISYEVLE